MFSVEGGCDRHSFCEVTGNWGTLCSVSVLLLRESVGAVASWSTYWLSSEKRTEEETTVFCLSLFLLTSSGSRVMPVP